MEGRRAEGGRAGWVGDRLCRVTQAAAGWNSECHFHARTSKPTGHPTLLQVLCIPAASQGRPTNRWPRCSAARLPPPLLLRHPRPRCCCSPRHRCCCCCWQAARSRRWLPPGVRPVKAARRHAACAVGAAACFLREAGERRCRTRFARLLWEEARATVNMAQIGLERLCLPLRSPHGPAGTETRRSPLVRSTSQHAAPKPHARPPTGSAPAGVSRCGTR